MTQFTDVVTAPGFVGGVASIPPGGKHYWVYPGHAQAGDGNAGTSVESPLKTVSAAYAKTTSGANDVIHLVGNGAVGGSALEAATITWSNNATHLVGHCSSTMISQRARIAPTAAATQFTPLITVSGNGCLFQNVEFIADFTTGVNAANGCMNVTGGRNTFVNCHIAGGVTALAADHASMYSLLLTGAEECLFKHCTIGLDTINRSAANTAIRCASAATRNIFEDCLVLSMGDAATPYFLDCGTSGCLDRFIMFKDTIFHNAVGSTSTTMTVGIKSHASKGGTIILAGDTFMVGATDLADDFTDIWGFTVSGNATYAQGVGLAVQTA